MSAIINRSVCNDRFIRRESIVSQCVSGALANVIRTADLDFQCESVSVDLRPFAVGRKIASDCAKAGLLTRSIRGGLPENVSFSVA